jgi:methyl-accepting chemotaxis protein
MLGSLHAFNCLTLSKTMKNWTIGKRITIGFIAMITLSIAIGGLAYYFLGSIRTHSRSLLDNNMPGAIYMGAIKDNVSRTYAILERHLLSTDKDEIAGLEKDFEALSADNADLLEKYGRTIITEEDRNKFNSLEKTRTEYVKSLEAVFNLSRADKNDEALASIRKEYDPIYKTYSAEIGDMVEFNRTKSLATGKNIENLMFSAVVWIVSGLCLVVLIAMLIAWFTISRTNKALGDIIKSIDEGSEQVASASMQVAAASNSLAEGASEQAASLEETSSSLEEMSSMTAQNAKSAQDARSVANEMRKAAEGSAAQMKEMQAAMDAIKESSAGISQIIKTIDEIAFQTNILALNAAVEAARAGEAGAGFAVVAGEVRNLAQRSAESAKETSGKIEGAIHNSDHGVALSAKVAESLGVIVGKAQTMDSLVGEIANASGEQDRGIGQLTTAVQQMDKVTQSNASSAEETASASEELSSHAEVLKETVRELEKLVGGSGTRTNGKTLRVDVSRSKVQPRPEAPKKPVAKAKTEGRFLAMSAKQ